MLANYLHARALADERHQRVAGEKPLRVMHQAYLEPVHRMTSGQQLETAEVRRENQRAFARIARRQIVPDVEPIVGDAAREAAVEESAHPHILGASAAEIDVRSAQNALALGGTFFRESNFEIANTDFAMPMVEAMEDQGASNAQLVENEVGQQAERMQRRDQHPENEIVLQPELKARALGLAARERKVRFLRPVAGQVGGSGATAQHLAGRFIQIAAVELGICRR